MWWYLDNDSVSWCWFADWADCEVPAVFLHEVILSININTSDMEDSTISIQLFAWVDLITCKIAITNELLTGLVHVKGFWKSLSSQIDWEWVSSIVREVNFSNLDGIISQEIVPLELEVTTWCEESKHFSVVIKELLLGWNSSSSKLLLKEFEEFWILLWWNWNARSNESVFWAHLSFRLRLSHIDEKFSGILISVIDSNSSSANSDIESYAEIFWLEWHFWAVLLQNHLPVKECSLWSSTVDHFWFCDENWSIFKEVENA